MIFGLWRNRCNNLILNTEFVLPAGVGWAKETIKMNWLSKNTHAIYIYARGQGQQPNTWSWWSYTNVPSSGDRGDCGWQQQWWQLLNWTCSPCVACVTVSNLARTAHGARSLHTTSLTCSTNTSGFPLIKLCFYFWCSWPI